VLAMAAHESASIATSGKKDKPGVDDLMMQHEILLSG